MQSPDDNLILWFDPARDWEPVLEHLSSDLNLLRYAGSQLEMRYWLENRPPDQQTVAYLPLEKEAISYLLPYRFTSKIFEEKLYEFLQEHDAPLSRSAQERSRIKTILPLLVQESIGKGVSFWEGISSYEQAQAALIKDFPGRLGQFLDQPAESWSSLESAGLAEHFRAMVESRLGYAAALDVPASYAQGLLTQLVLVELYCQSEGADDFPLTKLLPDSSRFDECRDTLDSWRYDVRYQGRFVQYVRTVEVDYSSLMTWAAKHPGDFEDPPLPGIAQAAWENMAENLAKCPSFDEVVALVEKQREPVQRAAQGFWAMQGLVPGWETLALAGKVITAAQQAVEEAPQLTSPAAFIEAYVREWWQVDQMFRQCKSALGISFVGDKTIAKWIDRFYTRFLSKTNQSWTSLLSKQPTWELTGLASPQDSFWDRISGTGGKRRAVLLIDGLRYELGEALRDRLDSEYEVVVEAMYTGLPSITALGMSALLPEARHRQVDWQDGDWLIQLPEFGGNLARKADRDKWLAARLEAVEILALSDLSKSDTRTYDGLQWLFATMGEIDAIGENTGTLTAATVDDLIERIMLGVRQLMQRGFDEVHICTDHGFLLLDEVADHGKADLSGGDWLKKAPRYAIAREVPTSEHLHYPITHSEELVGCFPHSVTCFKAYGKYNYVHGGPSLQEVIIPHLTVRSSVLSQPVGVEIEADEETRVAFFKITLKPVPQMLVSREREVRLTLENAAGNALHESQEVIGITGEIVKNMKVYPKDNIAFGDMVYVAVYDARTGEQLDRHAIRFLVSLDL